MMIYSVRLTKNEYAFTRKNFTGTSAITKEIKGSFRVDDESKCFLPVHSWKVLVSFVVRRVLCYLPGNHKVHKKDAKHTTQLGGQLKKQQNVPAYRRSVEPL